MASKLFHTVVGFGIALGATSVGCAAPEGDEVVAAESRITSDTPDIKAPADKDRFCEQAWPTTKGGPRPEQSQECVDPQHECGDYPTDPASHTVYHFVTCRHLSEASNTCDFTNQSLWMFCKHTKAGPSWSCPSGTVVETTCSRPDELTQ